jgi:hypothetical protein
VLTNNALSFWRRTAPLAGVALAVLVNAAWIGALGYVVVRLL